MKTSTPRNTVQKEEKILFMTVKMQHSFDKFNTIFTTLIHFYDNPFIRNINNPGIDTYSDLMTSCLVYHAGK